MRKSVSNWIRISESLIFHLQAADFVVGVVSFEHLEQAFEDPDALLPDFFRHPRHGIPLGDQRAPNRVGYGTAVVIRQLARCRTGFLVQNEGRPSASHQMRSISSHIVCKMAYACKLERNSEVLKEEARLVGQAGFGRMTDSPAR